MDLKSKSKSKSNSNLQLQLQVHLQLQLQLHLQVHPLEVFFCFWPLRGTQPGQLIFSSSEQCERLSPGSPVRHEQPLLPRFPTSSPCPRSRRSGAADPPRSDARHSSARSGAPSGRPTLPGRAAATQGGPAASLGSAGASRLDAARYASGKCAPPPSPLEILSYGVCPLQDRQFVRTRSLQPRFKSLCPRGTPGPAPTGGRRGARSLQHMSTCFCPRGTPGPAPTG